VRHVSTKTAIPPDDNDTQASAEQLVLSASSPTLKTAAIRTHGVFGAHDTNLIPIFVHALNSPGGRRIRFGDGQNLYDFTYVANAALGHVLAAEKLLGADYARANGLAFNVTNMEPVTFSDMLLAVWREFGHDSDVWTVTIPARGAYAMAWLGERVAWLIGRPPPITTGEIGDAFAVRWFDCSRAAEILGYRPVTGLNDGVRLACNVGL
jgi:sterol-4alpha-carboxylate 3-dehydrogenase (decarboxylating)